MTGFEMNCFIAFISVPLTSAYCYWSGHFEYLVNLDYTDYKFALALGFATVGGVLLSISKIAVNVTL